MEMLLVSVLSCYLSLYLTEHSSVVNKSKPQHSH